MLSEKIGEAYEYCVTEAIFQELKKLYCEKVRVTRRAKKMQERGKSQFEGLTREQKERFLKSAKAIARWLIENRLSRVDELKYEKVSCLSAFVPGKQSGEGLREIELDRIPDVNGVKGDVTDIRIKLFVNDSVATVNVSLKHRHRALKHPRLTRVPEWIGVANTREAKDYRKNYEKIWEEFFERGEKLLPGARTFRELKAKDPRFIEENLYKPFYLLIKEFLEKNIKNPRQVQKMFEFMVGRVNYIKFIDNNGTIEIRDFSEIPPPKSVEIKYDKYLYFKFDNGLTAKGRLHTAEESLKKSIKFDLQPVNLDSLVSSALIKVKDP